MKTLKNHKFVLAMQAMMLMAMVQGSVAQEDDKAYLQTANAIIDEALQRGKAYEMLRELSFEVGPRLSGSPQAAAAVEWGRETMIEHGLENVHLQEVMVPHWERGPIERAAVVNSSFVGTHELTVCALGGSIATPTLGVTAEVLEVQTMDELHQKASEAAGKIIFFNRPMDATKRNTFAAYGGAVNQRGSGAAEAAKVGAVAALVRSMTTALDDVPHTGGMHYEEGVPKIPSAAISTLDANFLSDLLKKGAPVSVNLQLSSRTLPDTPSANVVGEITGSELPDEVVLLGGHLDSWDKGHGAHDDGSGCVQSIEALRLLKALNLRPRRTIRAVLFMNEENGLRGGKGYAEHVEKNGPKHIVAIESDRGGFAPRGITVQAENQIVAKVARWSYLLEQIGADRIERGGGGADISPLVPQGTVTMGLMVESHRYFDYHHSANDTFDKVNERELTLGAATMAIIAYVLANEGL
ncbi:MAG: M20/M25/M40 family metallo-hydrolase [Deferribacteres bacterium]|nr:M20/M25/M40 family metallo-hydrolase [candidate division KSB1 bacterium]MCB9509533.1 M20/M25/M40 family metallo-hydrolase [Deferribacteres bacterium]